MMVKLVLYLDIWMFSIIILSKYLLKDIGLEKYLMTKFLNYLKLVDNSNKINGIDSGLKLNKISSICTNMMKMILIWK